VNGWIINEEGSVTGMIHAPLQDSGIRWAMPWRNPFIHTGVMFRAGDGVYAEEFRICQDWEFWSRLAERGRMANLRQRLVAYRHMEKSLSHYSAQRTEAESAKIVERIWLKTFGDRVADPDLLRNFRQGLSLENQCAFWSFYRETRQHWTGGSTRQAVAVHHLQAAGAFSKKNLRAILLELGFSFWKSPTFMLGVILEYGRSLCMRSNVGGVFYKTPKIS
jgi:hypothetical protein